MHEIIFATRNKNKVKEINDINSTISFISLDDVGISEDIPETGDTFEENAHQKAAYVFDRIKKPVLAEDSGLVVPSLHGEPGVLSARYAGDDKDDAKNIEKLLSKLTDSAERAAYFNTTICYIDAEGNAHYFTGRCHGHIGLAPAGTNGFGYDPIFIPNGLDKTFAECPIVEKNKISHRKRAFVQFQAFIADQYNA